MARRPLVACALLFGAYVALSLLNDPRGFLGTDTGAKVATLEVMRDRGRLDPDVGYWAERWDPAGRVHPLYNTTRVGDRWVNVTTLPMLYAAQPLYRLGGYRLALLFPMAGAVLAALAARALARRLSGGEGWGAFWVVGLASPIAVYALDFWEHSLGVAAMAWAVVVLLDVVEGERPWPWCLGAGLLFGAAATLRTEALVYAFVAVALACLSLLLRVRRLGAAVAAGLAASAGLAGPLLANAALEDAAVGQAIRSQRAAGTAVAAVSATGGAAASRLEEALLNAAALTPALDAMAYVLGIALAGLVALAVVRATGRGDAGPAVLAGAAAAALYAFRFVDGPGFVPGLVAATPVAVAGVALGWWSPASRYVVGLGLVALPLVWATQFQGGAAPQWAGRYLLTSGLLFGVVGVVVLPRLRQWARRGLVGLAGAVTAFGLVWTSIRTQGVADASAALNRMQPVMVSRIGHLVREGGAFYGERRWLTAATRGDEQFAADVVRQAGARRFGLVQFADRQPPDLAGWEAVGPSEEVRFLPDVDLRVTVYQAR